MVYWLRQMAHDQEVVGLNPGSEYWMVVSNATCNIITIITKINGAHQINIFKKYILHPSTSQYFEKIFLKI